MRRAYGYVRVSGAEQGRTGTSLDAQQAEIRRYCKAHGLPSPALHVEIESASAERLEQRAELRRLLAAVRPGDVVIVCTVDRWSRDIVHAVESVRALVRRGVGWISIREAIDASTPHGDSTLGILSWVADQERRRIRERTVVRRRALRDGGAYVEGLPPYGYRRGNRAAGEPRNVLRIVPERADLVREVYRRSIAGASIVEIVEWLQVDHGDEGRAWDAKTVGRMLRSRVYLGEVTTSRGAWVPAHEAIVDLATWQRAQDGLDARRLGGPRATTTARTTSWLLRGLATCAACGARMRAAYGATRDYYGCAAACGARLVRQDVADAATAALVVARLEQLAAELARDPGPAPERRDDGQRARLAARRTRTLDLYADGAIDAEELRGRLATIDRDLGRLAVAADDAARAAAVHDADARAGALARVGEIARAWRHLDPAERREVVRLLASGVALAHGEEPAPAWRDVADLL